ncbi:MAG: outer membrane beta-barrel protein [Cyclobacteriaceae bacterium]|nr:outer membrane beta-barrel protein [Cyclobacteriaceae bacterium]
MKTINISLEQLRMARTPINPILKSILLSAFILVGLSVPLQAQDAQYTNPSWWFGAAAGANVNFYRGTTQELNNDLTVPTAFRHGTGLGIYAAPLLEFHRPDSKWGVMLQAGYDGRQAKFEQVISPCNCPQDLSTKLSYLTIEPSLRFAPFKSNFYVFGGPRFAFNTANSFTYKQGINPAFPDQIPTPDVEGKFSKTNNALLSMQIGAGYDIELSTGDKRTKAILSPFISFQPDLGQDPRSIETWTVSTLRFGAALKFGRGHKVPQQAENKAEVIAMALPTVFTVNSPTNIPVERRVRETFPVRNYVFFDLGSTQIPDRYVLITKDQVKDFKEDQLEIFAPKTLSGRSDREMTVYYNVLNILGDRMNKNESSTISLVGSSEKGPQDAKLMAESIKQYLVNTFGVHSSRIVVEGRNKPKIQSEQPRATKELDLLRQEDRRVSIESASPALLMEFQSGPNVPLKPVEMVTVQTAPLDSYVTFKVDGADEAYAAWSLDIKDKNGIVQNFGPYYSESVSIPGKSILGTKPSGDYLVTMIGTTKKGNVIKKETSVHMVLWTPPQDEMGMRFSIIYEFNNSESIYMYEKYLTEIVTPKIPEGGKVVIHGYTDVIGDTGNNLDLSIARANDVRKILESALAKAGRKDVKFESYGFGEDEKLALFENKLPEERFYNRSVIIDIIPASKD